MPPVDSSLTELYLRCYHVRKPILPQLFEEESEGVFVLVLYDSSAYRSSQAHTPQSQWMSSTHGSSVPRFQEYRYWGTCTYMCLVIESDKYTFVSSFMLSPNVCDLCVVGA